MSNKNQLLEDLERIQELFPQEVNAVIGGRAYFTEPPSIDLDKDRVELCVVPYQDAYGCWGICVEAHWGYLGRYPIAFIRTNMKYDENVGLGEPFSQALAIVKHYNAKGVTFLNQILAEYM